MIALVGASFRHVDRAVLVEFVMRLPPGEMAARFAALLLEWLVRPAQPDDAARAWDDFCGEFPARPDLGSFQDLLDERYP